MSSASVTLVLVAVLVGAPRLAPAQQPAAPSASPELRADVIVGFHPAIQVGAGAQLPIGYYVRIGLDAAVGYPLGERVSTSSSPARRIGGRLDLLARFLLDPFRQSAYGLSVGGGMSLRAEPGERALPLLLVAVDVEGRRSRNGVVPAVQIGLGGGARIGVILRRGNPGSR